jgi:hypothetical protein
MTEIIPFWVEQPDGTFTLTGVLDVVQPGVDAWSTCNVDEPLPTSCRHDWLINFGNMVGAACEVESLIAHPKWREDITAHPSPVLAMLCWTIRCTRLVASELTRLRIARLELPMPSEMRGTAAKAFCEQIVEVVERRCTWLQRHFVTHTKASLELPMEERLSHESMQICEQFETIAQRWQFEPINPAEWMRLIELELNKCDWLKEQELLTAEDTGKSDENRRMAVRDAIFLRWREAGLTDAKIRDRWNAENPDNKISVENTNAGRDTVRNAIRREKKRKTQGTT